MTVEVATYINDLQPVNPPSGDPVSQGDDHIRLVKQVLQNTLGNATRQFIIPGTFAFSVSTTLTKSNGEGTVYVGTGAGAVTMTLPTLTALDAGWKIHFVKTTSDVNPIFIKPASGTINSGGISALAQARRCIPGVRVTAIWDGTNWFVTRANSLPIGSMIEYYGTTLPAGFEWPSGQTLTTGNYLEYNAVVGNYVTPDVRGYTSAVLDNLGGTAAGRLPTTFIASTTLGGTGGTDHSTLVTANLPPYTPSGTVATSVTINWGSVLNFLSGGTPLQFGGTGSGGSVASNPTASASSTFTGTAQGGTSTAFSNLQPTIMVAKLLVVE